MAKAGNTQLGEAKKAKKDEFYTQLGDINAEPRHYSHHFAAIKLKRLIATCYAGSSVAGRQLELFDWGEENETGFTGLTGLSNRSGENEKPRIPHKIVINEVTDVNGDGRIDLADVEWLIKNDKNVLTKLKGDGDFRSAECVELLKQADIVVTNPPFSLFREYVAQLGRELGLNPVPKELKKVNPSLRDGQLYLMKDGKPVKPFSRIIIRRKK